MSETKTKKVTGVGIQYKVYTVGYMQQFPTYENALKAFEKMRNKKIREEETFKLSLSSREGAGDRWQVLDTVKIGEDYYSK